MGAAGTDAALETADIVLTNDKVSDLIVAQDLARETFGLVKQNIGIVGVPNLSALLIGTFLPVTGNLAFLAPPEIAAVKLAVKDIEEAGGIPGFDKIVLEEGDSGDTSTQTGQQTVKRLLPLGIDVLIGASSSGSTSAGSSRWRSVRSVARVGPTPAAGAERPFRSVPFRSAPVPCGRVRLLRPLRLRPRRPPAAEPT